MGGTNDGEHWTWWGPKSPTDCWDRKEERTRLSRALLQPFFILSLLEPPLVVCLISQYAGNVEVVLQYCQAL